MPSAAPEPPSGLAPPLVDRFRADLARHHALGPNDRLGIAVSGGPDSLGLLLLAHAAFPGRIEAATVDHGLRPESAGEAAMVAEVCSKLGVPHATLTGVWNSDRKQGLQAAARDYRYRELKGWCSRQGLPLLATAHHADDQAETLLMRLARGAGIGGLGSIRSTRPLTDAHSRQRVEQPERTAQQPHPHLVRPLLRFTKAELIAIVAHAGLSPVIDPSNADDRFDRTRARRLLAETPWLDPARLAAAASHLADADTALDWAASTEGRRRVRRSDETALEWTLDPADLPDEILRRIVETLLHLVEDHAIARFDPRDPAGPDLTRFIARLKSGQSATMWHVLARPGPSWRFGIAPPRRP